MAPLYHKTPLPNSENAPDFARHFCTKKALPVNDLSFEHNFDFRNSSFLRKVGEF
jgi:hypothetical protein